MTNTTDTGRALPATRAQAEQILKLVEQKYYAWLSTFEYTPGQGFDFSKTVPVPAADHPQIFMNWGDDNATVIAWENNSPHDWALCPLSDDQREPEFGFLVKGVEVPGSLSKVYTDAYFSFVLAIYQES